MSDEVVSCCGHYRTLHNANGCHALVGYDTGDPQPCACRVGYPDEPGAYVLHDNEVLEPGPDGRPVIRRLDEPGGDPTPRVRLRRLEER